MPEIGHTVTDLFLVQNTSLWEDSAAVGGTFRVDWKRRFDLPFLATNHLYNPLNEGKPVRIGRDGQEVPADVGRALCQLFDEGADAAGVPPPTRPAGALCIPYLLGSFLVTHPNRYFLAVAA